MPQDYDQTVVTAEHMAACQWFTQGMSDVVAIDCNAVYLAGAQSLKQRCRLTSKFAGYWKQVARIREPNMRKAAAHRELPENETSFEDTLVVLNANADEVAKLALKWHQVPEVVQTDYKRAAALAMRMLSKAVEATAGSPSYKCV